MGNRITNQKLQGIGIPDWRFVNEDKLAGNTATALSSKYTEQNPRPGLAEPLDPDSKLVPRIHNAQSNDVNLRIKNGGMPTSNGVRVAYKLDTEEDVNWRGWNQPSAVTFWEPLDWAGTDYKIHDATTTYRTQEIVAVALGSYVRIWKWNDADGWVNTVNQLTYANGTIVTAETAAITTLPNGRILLVTINTNVLGINKADAFFSDDDGVTWEEWATRVIPYGDISDTVVKASMTALGEHVALALLDTTQKTITQFSSIDLGMSFTLIDTVEQADKSVSLFTLAGDAGIGLVTLNSSSGLGEFRKVNSVTQSLESVEPINIHASELLHYITAYSDYEGTLWAISVWEGESYLFKSTDQGNTWLDMRTAELGKTYGFLTTTTDPLNLYLIDLIAVPCRGFGVLFTSHGSTVGTYDGEASVFFLGGWTNVEYDGFATDLELPNMGGLYLPYCLPTDSGWTHLGTATGTLIDTGYMELETVGSSGYYTITTATDLNVTYIFDLMVPSGGTVGSRAVGIELRVADGILEYGVNINCHPEGFRFIDSTSVQHLFDLGWSLGTERIQLLIDIRADQLRVWYKNPDNYHNLWVPAGEAELALTTGGLANGVVRFGNITSGDAISHWRMVGFSRYLVRTEAEFYGKTINQYPYPVPGVSIEDKFAYLSLIAGPGYNAEEFFIPVDHDYPVSNLFPAIAPSPNEVWRSREKTEQIFTFDIGTQAMIGEGMFLYLDNVNFRTAYLEYHNGSDWVTAGTYDGATGFENVFFMNRGHTLTPSTSSAVEGGRYLQANEVAGGFINNGSNVARIRSHTGGSWTRVVPKTARPMFDIDKQIGSIFTGSGNGALVWPRGVLFVHFDSYTYSRYWRVRIPNQTCPDSYFQIGTMMIGSIAAFGQESSWEWSQSISGNYEERTNDFGTAKRRKKGPPKRQWSMAFNDPVNLQTLRDGNLDHDYFAANDSSLALVAQHDVWWQLDSILTKTEGYTVPVVAFNSIPENNVTITDKTHFLYGYLTGSVQYNNVVGEEGENEVGRIDKLTIEGIV